MLLGTLDITVQDLDECVDSLNGCLDRVAADTTTMTLVIALMVHVNARLRFAIDSGICSDDAAVGLGDIMLRHLAQIQIMPEPSRSTH
jgi:hypothetical protein